MLPGSLPVYVTRSIYNAHMIQYYSKHKNGTLAQSCFYNIMYAYKTLLPESKATLGVIAIQYCTLWQFCA